MMGSRSGAILALALAGTILGGCGQRSAAAGDTASAAPAASPAAVAACDRDCLIKLTDTYLAAIAARDPKAAPLADNVLFVENARRLKPGEGLWKTATGGPTAFSIHVPDPVLQQAGWLGVVEQDGKPVILALRLKVVDGRIVEAEHLISPPGRGDMDNLHTVRPGLLATIPEGQRLAHDQLLKIGASYYDALDDNKGSLAPFAPDCQRRENGMTTAGAGVKGFPIKDPNPSPIAHDCKGQMDSQSFVYIKTIDDRRMIAADPQTGLVMGLSHFRHPMNNLPYKVIHEDGTTSERNAQNMPYKPFDMPAAHIFRVGPEGQIHEIEAVGFMAPFNSPTGRE